MSITDEMDKLIEESADGKTTFVAHPDDIQKLIDSGKIKKRFISYDEYADGLFEERRKEATKSLSKLPLLNEKIADSVASSIYEEIRSSVAFGVPTSSIINAIMLLEYSLRVRLYKERLKDDPNAEWYVLEGMDMSGLIRSLYKKGSILTDEEKEKLISFSEEFRNPYLHINIQKLVEGIYISKLPSVNADTYEIKEMENVDVAKHRYTWFSAKKFFDKTHLQSVLEFCIGWTNKLLVS